MADVTGASDRPPEETERLDEELSQLLNEMRLAMPGIQVLFAFLLAVPFAQGFRDVGSFDRDVYLFSLICAALSCAFMIAPSAYHRLMFRRGDKEYLVKLAGRLTVTSLVFLGLSMNAAIYLVSDTILARTEAIVITACTTLVFVVLWFGIAAARRMGGR